MKRFLARFASQFFSKKELQKFPMEPLRYFPNTSPDLKDGSVEPVQIPVDILKISILNIVDNIRANVNAVECKAEEGLYLGSAGISYMFYHMSKQQTLLEHRHKFLESAWKYIQPALKATKLLPVRRDDVPAFLLGHCGIYAVASAIYKAIGNLHESDCFRLMYHESANICMTMRFLACGSDELFVGRAGYLCGALWLAKETNSDLVNEHIFVICRVIVDSGREYSQRHRCSSPLMYSYYNVEYLGAGHGLCSILQMLMTVPGYLDSNPADAKDIKKSVDFLLSLQTEDGNFPCATDEIGQKNDLVHWCHGAGGIVYLMAKAYLIWHDERYLKACEKAASLVWEKGLLKKGPGICHGVAGNGYVFLLLYRLTHEPKYLHRAVTFAQFLETEEFKRDSRVPDNPYSLYEGIAGTACFLSDLTNPERASFPFSDVF